MVYFVSLVCLFSSLKDPKITRRELVSVHSNGVVLSCQGLFLGQLLVKMSRQADSIVVLQLASLPDLGFVVSAINGLIASHFQQCMFLFSLLFACFTLRLLLVLLFSDILFRRSRVHERRTVSGMCGALDTLS